MFLLQSLTRILLKKLVLFVEVIFRALVHTSLHVPLIFLQVLANLGAADIDSRLEEQLIDGILFAFQEQTNEVSRSFSVCI